MRLHEEDVAPWSHDAAETSEESHDLTYIIVLQPRRGADPRARIPITLDFVHLCGEVPLRQFDVIVLRVERDLAERP